MTLDPLTSLDKDIEDSAGKSGKYANMEGNCQLPLHDPFLGDERARGPTRAMHQKG